MAISAAPASRPCRRPTRSRKMPQTGEKPNIPEKCALRIKAMTPMPTPRADAAMAYTAISPVIAPWARPMAIAPARMAGSRSRVRIERLRAETGVFRSGARSLGSGRSANMQPKATAEKIAAITQDAASRAGLARLRRQQMRQLNELRSDDGTDRARRQHETHGHAALLDRIHISDGRPPQEAGSAAEAADNGRGEQSGRRSAED